MPMNWLHLARFHSLKVDCRPWSCCCIDFAQRLWTVPYCGTGHVPLCTALHWVQPARPVRYSSSKLACDRPWHRCHPCRWPIADALQDVPWRTNLGHPGRCPIELHSLGSRWQSSASMEIINGMKWNRCGKKVYPIVVASNMFFTVVAETRTAIIFGLHLTNSQKAEQKGCQNILHHHGAVQVELRVVRLYS